MHRRAAKRAVRPEKESVGFGRGKVEKVIESGKEGACDLETCNGKEEAAECSVGGGNDNGSPEATAVAASSRISWSAMKLTLASLSVVDACLIKPGPSLRVMNHR